MKLGPIEVSSAQLALIALCVIFVYFSVVSLLAFFQFWFWGNIALTVIFVILSLATGFSAFFKSKIALIVYFVILGTLIVLALLAFGGLFTTFDTLGFWLSLQGLFFSVFEIILFTICILIGVDLFQDDEAHWGVPWKRAEVELDYSALSQFA